MTAGLSVGIDVGGTFTDLAAVAADGSVRTAKVLSEPADQSVGVLASIDALGAPAAEVARLVHGTTVVTNLLLERRGARVVLCATEGHTDVLHLRRQERARLYDLAAHHPPALVPGDATVAVPERVTPRGVQRALTDAGADAVAARVRELAPEAVAVALLHAHAFDGHERALARALARALPGVEVALSSEVLPEIREYERASTTAAEAYARPRVAGYLGRLGARLAERGLPAPGVMTSGGGVRESHEAARSAAALALSGPAGGVAGAAAVLASLGGAYPLALTIDIGGTSADVGLIVDGEPLVESGGVVAGVPIALPRVLVETVSAGGGSVGWVDDAGALRVGPRSAGAVPGPAAFARGGTEATVTDAHVVLGTVAPGVFSGGVRVDAALAHRAVAALCERLGEPTDRATLERVARAMVAAADAEMARALRRVSVERGVDPRACVLVAFGGGGPLHACALAERLEVRRVLVPPHAGVLSAVGLAAAPARRESMSSVMRLASALSVAELAALHDALAARAGAHAASERQTWLRARYVGQGYELDVPVAAGEDGATVAQRFAALHERRTGFTLPRDVEVVSARHAASAPGVRPTFARPRRGGPVPTPPAGAALVDDGRALERVVHGPATIVLADATLHVARGWTARALEVGGWLVEAG